MGKTVFVVTHTWDHGEGRDESEVLVCDTLELAKAKVNAGVEKMKIIWAEELLDSIGDSINDLQIETYKYENGDLPYAVAMYVDYKDYFDLINVKEREILTK